jgi:hypothetical protein
LEKDPEKRPELRHFEDDSEDAETKFLDEKQGAFEDGKVENEPKTPAETPTEDTTNDATTVAPPKKNNNTLIIAIIVGLVVLGVVGALTLGRKPSVNDDNADVGVMRVTYSSKVAEFEELNSKINTEHQMTNKGYVIDPLKKLREIEQIENNPRFSKLGVNRESTIKLKEYREKITQLSIDLQKELDKVGSSSDDDVWVKSLKETKNLVHEIMELTKGGSVKNIDIDYLKSKYL